MTPNPTDHEPHGDPVPGPGDRLERYVLQKSLGRGVSCFVFRAWDTEKEIPVAIKLVNWSNVRDREAALKQLRTEAAALARVRHPRVVRFIDFGFHAEWPYLVLEYVEGRTLGELLREGGALPIRWSLAVLGQLIEGLAAVWKAGIVHRDVKPDNVIVGPGGLVKLIDFGVALSEALQIADGANANEMAGTPAYLAPEQARNASAADWRADVYSLGALYFELLTGRPPFDGRSKMQLILQHLNEPAPTPRAVRPELPELVADLCRWMLAKSPDDRPRSLDELHMGYETAVREFESGESARG
jgi:serine/threonine protein kinase